jgi:putative transposase
LTLTHTQRCHAHRHTAGTGHLYQGRFKSFPIQRDEHLLTVLRYVERNPLRAGLVQRAEDWRWGSLWRREHGTAEERGFLASWPVEMSRRWVEVVNAVQTQAEEEAVRRAIQRGRPVGSAAWVERAATRLGLERTLRPRGRPRKVPKKGS